GLLYSTYLGGSAGPDAGGGSEEYISGIAVDAAGVAYLTGQTSRTDFPTTAGALQAAYGGGGQDAFLTKIDSAQSGAKSLAYSTYLGGSSGEGTTDLVVDAAGRVLLAGGTVSPDFPTASPSDRVPNPRLL